ncbi:MAG: ATP-binding cassette domain-containing protein, partial [Alphaproteobacteria bacterium]|nr:ATP-binding cassette domain-containing protein [Alphaproteobacteria bacterium]
LCRGENRGIALALSPHTREKIVHHLKDLHLGLERRLKDPVGLLSGGQRQTLSLLMAILRPMKILALDEHTAALDPKTASFVIELTKKIVEERQLTTLMVTHSMSHALNVGTRTIMLHHGKIVLDISGEKRKKLSVPDLLNLFKKNSGDKIEESSLLLD